MTFLRPYWFAVSATIAISLADMAAAHEPNGGDASYHAAQVPRAYYRSILDEYQASPTTTPPVDWRELDDLAEKIGGPRGQLRSIGEPIRKRKDK